MEQDCAGFTVQPRDGAVVVVVVVVVMMVVATSQGERTAGGVWARNCYRVFRKLEPRGMSLCHLRCAIGPDSLRVCGEAALLNVKGHSRHTQWHTASGQDMEKAKSTQHLELGSLCCAAVCQ